MADRTSSAWASSSTSCSPGSGRFAADSLQEMLRLVAEAEPRPPRQLDDAISRELERICLKALARRASDRYATAIDLADDLEHFLASSTPGADSRPCG